MPTLKQQLQAATPRILQQLKQPNDATRAWDHCYKFFGQLPENPNDDRFDHMALHLAVYLANYGMYRASAFLPEKNYKFLIPVVKFLQSPEMETDRAGSDVAQATSKTAAHTAWDRLVKLESFLRCDPAKFDQKNLSIVITKVMLGTWASTPAFDTYFKKGLFGAGLGCESYDRNNFEMAFAAIHARSVLFQEEVTKFHAAGFPHYPAMRVIDLLIWRIGANAAVAEDAAEEAAKQKRSK